MAKLLLVYVCLNGCNLNGPTKPEKPRWSRDTIGNLITHTNTCTYTGCPRRKGPNFGRVFLRSNYNNITQNTYIQSSMVTEILAGEV